MLTSGEPCRYAPEKTTREKLNRMHYHATGVRPKGGVKKGTPRPATFGSGVRARTVRAKEDKARRAAAQDDYERLIEERAKSARAPRSS